MLARKHVNIIFGGLSAILFGISGILASVLFQRINMVPEWLVGMRMFWSGLLLILVLACKFGGSIFSIWYRKVDAILIILFGVIGVLLAQSSFFLSVYFGDAAMATILQSLGPTIIIILLSIFYRKLPVRMDTVSIIIALIGVFLLVTNGDIGHLKVTTQALFWGIISAFGVAAYTLIPRPLLQQHHALLVVAWGLLIGGIAENLIQPLWHIPNNLQVIDWSMIGFIIIGSTLVPYALYVLSLCHLAPTTASLLGIIEPLTATLISVTLLGVQLLPVQMIGVCLILSTIILISLPVERIVEKFLKRSA